MKQTGHLIPPLCMETFWYSYSYISKVSSHKRSSELQYQSKVSITKHMEHRSSETIAAAAAAAASLQSCPSLRPHRRQPTRLPHPWDSPGKNTGVGCHFLLHCMKVKSESEVAQSQPHGLQPTRLLRPWGFPGESTGVGCHCLLHSIT